MCDKPVLTCWQSDCILTLILINIYYRLWRRDCILTPILMNIHYRHWLWLFSYAYTYQHLQQTLTERLNSYAGLSQMKEIRLLSILINIYYRLWRRDCILTLVSRRWRRFGCCTARHPRPRWYWVPAPDSARCHGDYWVVHGTTQWRWEACGCWPIPIPPPPLYHCRPARSFLQNIRQDITNIASTYSF